MKAKYVWVALLALTFFGCDDNTGTIGWDMLPDSDQNINGRYTTYELTMAYYTYACIVKMFSSVSIGCLFAICQRITRVRHCHVCTSGKCA